MIWFVVLGFVLIGIILTFIRFLFARNFAERMVAVDGGTTITVGLIAILSLIFGRGIYLDVALMYGVLAFVAVVVIARYIEGGF
ncbi:cation:proton antiporter [bacterium]|uniref:Cation:proton antiporter n=1 Tax=candidate division WOR-3 bacterium TaxID=2052148 RepID=A0A7C0VD07_UNCW3|nr:MAG: cation:proton antiporter [bacterium]HDI83455.1 cation:proton antiporter [candidate division WOR-3 bacterium]